MRLPVIFLSETAEKRLIPNLIRLIPFSSALANKAQCRYLQSISERYQDVTGALVWLDEAAKREIVTEAVFKKHTFDLLILIDDLLDFCHLNSVGCRKIIKKVSILIALLSTFYSSCATPPPTRKIPCQLR